MNPSDALNQLGAVWSPSFDDYATGRIGAGQVHCLLCDGPCGPDHPEFGTPEYMAAVDRIHGRTR